MRDRDRTIDPLGGAIGVRELAFAMVVTAAMCLLVRLFQRPDVSVSIIPTLAALTIKHFKHSDKEDHEPRNDAIRFLLHAWNGGNFDEAEKYVAPECEIYLNGLADSVPSAGDGPTMLRQSIEHWRAIVPDLRMELSQEVEDKDMVATGWRIAGTHTGAVPELPASGGAIDIEMAAFILLEKDKIAEVWTVFDALSFAVQVGAIDAPAWWPGREST